MCWSRVAAGGGGDGRGAWGVRHQGDCLTGLDDPENAEDGAFRCDTETYAAQALRAHILADPGLSSVVYQTEERPAGPVALPFIGFQVRSDILTPSGRRSQRLDAS